MEFRIDDTIVSVNMPTGQALRTAVVERFRNGQGFALATINLDHLAKLEIDPAFRRAYLTHELVVADGWPIVTLSRIAGKPVDLMPGSDLVVPLCRVAAQENVAVALFGSTEPALRDATRTLMRAVPGLRIAASIAPPEGFDPQSEDAAGMLTEIRTSGARLCLVALGAPKQEILAARGRLLAPDVGFASIGAGLDFLGGHQKRAPVAIRRVRLEWLWRALTSPRRLVPRYLRAARVLPRHVLRAWRIRRTGRR